MVFSCWIQNVLESCPNNVYYVAYSPPSTASVSDVLQILFLEDGLPAFYSAKTQDVLLSVRSLIDDLMLAMDLYQRKEKWFSNNSPLRVKLCFWNFFPNITFINTNVSKQNVLNKRNWHPKPRTIRYKTPAAAPTESMFVRSSVPILDMHHTYMYQDERS